MPELPDLEAYVEALNARIIGARLTAIRLLDPFVLRSVDPPVEELVGRTVHKVRRIGKRLIIELDGELFVIMHLMIAGRLKWLADAVPAKPRGLLALQFSSGTVLLTEAGTTRRAALHLARGREALARLDRGGLEIFEIDAERFARQLRSENHTVKRALTDPRLFAGIGNAYSDEILHRARLSPVTLTRRLSEEEIARLFDAAQSTLREWTELFRSSAAERFPEKVTAFRPEMAVHGKFGQPCPVCGAPVQRIRYAANETNYCARCQTGGRRLADRALSRLLREDWPRSIDDVE